MNGNPMCPLCMSHLILNGNAGTRKFTGEARAGQDADVMRRRFVSTLDCDHLALTGADRLHPSNPEKLWRCDGCGVLAVPNGTALLVHLRNEGYVYRRIWVKGVLT